jgi:hypothetical protein
MMKAVSGEETDDGLRSDLIETAEKTGLDDPFFEALVESGGEPGSALDITDPVAEATTAVVEGHFDEAFRLLQQANASPGKVRGLVYVHNSLQTLDVEHALETALKNLGESERENLVEQFEICRRILEAGPPSGWTDWFVRIQQEDYDSPEQALQDAERLVEEWHPQQVLDKPNGLARFVRAVEDAPLYGEAGRTVSRALPKLLESLQNDPEYPRSTFQGLYGAVQDRIPYTDDLTQSDLTVYQDLVEVRLQHGVSKSDYEEIIAQAEHLWEEAGSAGRIDWLLDFAELLVLAPSRDEEAQLRFLSSVLQAIQKYRGHVESIQIDFFCSLCEEIEQPEVAEQVRELGDRDEDDESSDKLCLALNGKTLGIYTLTESAGRRVKAFLESRCGGVTVKLRHDKKGSAELHRVAENADYFLVVTRSATHAATDVIEQHVPTERLIYPRGKGESSMIRDLTETLAQE